MVTLPTAQSSLVADFVDTADERKGLDLCMSAVWCDVGISLLGVYKVH